MLIELLQTLVESKHKTVIFSQYTRMLQIMRDDFEQRGIKFSYLDGSSKNRLETVKEFNENESISPLDGYGPQLEGSRPPARIRQGAGRPKGPHRQAQLLADARTRE